VQLKKIEAVTQKNIDDGIIPGAVNAGGAPRQGRVGVGAGQARARFGRCDENRHDLPHVFDDQAGGHHRADADVEEGKLQVTDPVSKYLPEIGNMKVGTEVEGSDGKPMLRLSDPTRPMTVQDLMRHTSGLTYGNRGDSLIHKSYMDAKIGDRTATVEEMVTRLSKLALALQSRRPLGI